MSWKYFGNLCLITVLVVAQPAAAWFETCSHTVNLGVGGSMYVNSPSYSNRYPPGTSCRYIITAPLDYELNIQCSISMDKGPSVCSTEYFYVSTDGNSDLQNSEYFCGEGYVQRKSLFNKISIAYTSSSNTAAGAFSCLVTTNSQPCDCGWSTTSKIVGGTETQPNEFPFMAGIVDVTTSKVVCGGSIISHRTVLTACHCFGSNSDPRRLGVVVGDHNLQTGSETPYARMHAVESFRCHENYNSASNLNDIALVATKTNIEWSRGVSPACLPFLYSYASFENVPVEMAGWGTTAYGGPQSSVLRKAQTTVLSNSACQPAIQNTLYPEQMCTYSPSQDSCQSDSGGPLIRRFQRLFVLGIISFGRACGSNTPGVNTRVTSYLDWIQRNVGENLCQKN